MPNDNSDMSDARDRQRNRAEHVENILDEVEADVRDRKYPVGSEDLATEYADQPIDMPNETESMGDVFRRLDDEYDTPEGVREALHGELTGEAGGRGEYNDERDLTALDDAEDTDTV
ncbi:DUF5789 family protein [Halococcus hamelinensis]|uniref:DUF2795 domain-containing protein n=1 Tax=Halococcus hamelinensis 100A6 TaxID=1132509 RepID=M0M6B1_9EURY|nr:hypothetical protein [Halococcus hamelinensis]EMA39910.1 hypothetical protein C447_05143 [Halococcus hamelinensis 100A6]